MGMSIDTVKSWLKIQRDQRKNKLNHLAPSLIGDKRIESLDTAISYLEDYQELLSKYEKIKEIIKDWEDGRFSDAVGCFKISAVLEDGNDD